MSSSKCPLPAAPGPNKPGPAPVGAFRDPNKERPSIWSCLQPISLETADRCCQRETANVPQTWSPMKRPTAALCGKACHAHLPTRSSRQASPGLREGQGRHADQSLWAPRPPAAHHSPPPWLRGRQTRHLSSCPPHTQTAWATAQRSTAASREVTGRKEPASRLFLNPYE